jgi:hypothetical protein
LNPQIELLDPKTGTIRSAGALAKGPSASGHSRVQLVALPDGRFLIVSGQVGPQISGRHGIDPVSAQIFDPATGALIAAPPVDHAIDVAVPTLDGRVVVAGEWVAAENGCETGGEFAVNDWVGVYDPSLGLLAESRNPCTGTATLPVTVAHRYTGGAMLADGRIALLSDDHPADGSELGNSVDILSLLPR